MKKCLIFIVNTLILFNSCNLTGGKRMKIDLTNKETLKSTLFSVLKKEYNNDFEIMIPEKCVIEDYDGISLWTNAYNVKCYDLAVKEICDDNHMYIISGSDRGEYEDTLHLLKYHKQILEEFNTKSLKLEIDGDVSVKLSGMSRRLGFAKNASYDEYCDLHCFETWITVLFDDGKTMEEYADEIFRLKEFLYQDDLSKFNITLQVYIKNHVDYWGNDKIIYFLDLDQHENFCKETFTKESIIEDLKYEL